LEDEVDGDGLVHGGDGLVEGAGEGWDGGEVYVCWEGAVDMLVFG
jgi:hypothetical protein